jgi:hypothetical protein
VRVRAAVLINLSPGQEEEGGGGDCLRDVWGQAARHGNVLTSRFLFWSFQPYCRVMNLAVKGAAEWKERRRGRFVLYTRRQTVNAIFWALMIRSLFVVIFARV